VSPGAAQVFAYYRVRPADASAAIAAVRTLHDSLRAAMPGLMCTLSRRADGDTELLTLMETYAHADGVGEVWRITIECGAREALAAWVVGKRHVEVFVPCA
jgi:Domain of unknown function (DUF4936)